MDRSELALLISVAELALALQGPEYRSVRVIEMIPQTLLLMLAIVGFICFYLGVKVGRTMHWG
jgi:hypothetical protein